MNADDEKKSTKTVVSDAISERVLNRSFMYNRDDPLYHDCILVRFEDGKLNPDATFRALAAFLDLPYSETMTYCSERFEKFRMDENGVDHGMDTEIVYRTYDEYINDSERCFIEYFLRDAYAFYGYDFQIYDGTEMSEGKIQDLMNNFERMDYYMRETWVKVFQGVKIQQNGIQVSKDLEELMRGKMLDDRMKKYAENRIHTANALMKNLRFVNRKGQPLCMMPMLKPDPALLKQPLYH